MQGMTTEHGRSIDHETAVPLLEPSPGKLDIVIVENDEGFKALEKDWNALLAGADATIFQSFEWLYSWWKYFGNGGRLHCLVLSSGGRVVGIAPLFKVDVNVLGVRLATHLQFIGKGLSDYVDVIILRGYEKIVLDALARHLRETAATWDVFDCEDVPGQSPVLGLLPDAASRLGIKSTKYQGNVCPRIILPTREEATRDKKGPALSYNYKRKYKLLQAAGEARVEQFRRISDDLRKGVEMFSELHGRRWKSLGFPSAFDEEKHRAFHVEVAERFARRDWLRLYFLSVNGVPLSVCFNFNFNKTIYMYQCNAHGSDELMKSSPGFLIRAVAMEEGITEGMQAFDFLRGNESYKYTEGDATETKNWLIRFSSPQGTLRFALFLGQELVKKSFARARVEYFEYRRYTIARKPSRANGIRYIGSRLLGMLRMGVDFVQRHLFHQTKEQKHS
jgi:CelD/BcsL family acetyltransferase involved in cellulose biosynthesis